MTLNDFEENILRNIAARADSLYWLKLLSCVCQVWVGTNRGIVFICDVVSRQFVSRLSFHIDAVSSTCTSSDRFVFTAAGQLDGRVAVWRWPRVLRAAAAAAAASKR